MKRINFSSCMVSNLIKDKTIIVRKNFDYVIFVGQMIAIAEPWSIRYRRLCGGSHGDLVYKANNPDQRHMDDVYSGNPKVEWNNANTMRDRDIRITTEVVAKKKLPDGYEYTLNLKSVKK